MIPQSSQVPDIVRQALAEDLGHGDVTTNACVPPDRLGKGTFLAKRDGILSGLYVVAECVRQAAPDCALDMLADEGEAFTAGDTLARIAGPAAQILGIERVALNFLQRLCGVATLTGQFVRAAANSKATILDTRKTTPGLRLLEKAAVRAGGGSNHRFGLYDGVIIKDNHIEAAGGVAAAICQARAHLPHTLNIEVEVKELDQVDEALQAGADVIMLDNMSVQQMTQAVELIGDRALVEASGGVDLDTVAKIAATGVDFISVGRLTHSAPAVDISLDLSAQ